MLRTVYYARVSTEEEHQTAALITQCMENEEFINNKDGWFLTDKYIDEGKSGTTTEGRTEFNRMLSDMEEDKFDIILIKQIDRGWRNLGDWKTFENILVKSDIKLFIRLRNDYYDIRDDGSYISTTMDSMFAEWYSRNLSKKINTAHQTRMKKGTVVTNGKMWGYYQKNAQLTINEEEAEIIRYVFDLYIEGKSFRSICNILEDEGITNKNGGNFSITTLKRMIRNEKYKGVLVCGKTHVNFFTKEIEKMPKEQWVIHEDKIPAIVSKEKWEKANQILYSKKQKTDKEKVAGYFNGSYPLSSKIKCSKCGATYYHNIYTVNSRKYGIWQCSTYAARGKEKGCDNKVIRENDLNSIVKEVMFKMWEDKDEQIQRVITTLENSIKDDDCNIELNRIEEEINKLSNRKEKLFDLYADELITKEEYSKRNTSFDKSIKEKSMKYQTLKKNYSKEGTKEIRMKKIHEFLNQDLKNVKSVTDAMMKELVDEIVIYPDRSIDITLKGHSLSCVSYARQSGHANRSRRSSL